MNPGGPARSPVSTGSGASTRDLRREPTIPGSDHTVLRSALVETARIWSVSHAVRCVVDLTDVRSPKHRSWAAVAESSRVVIRRVGADLPCRKVERGVALKAAARMARYEERVPTQPA